MERLQRVSEIQKLVRKVAATARPEPFGPGHGDDKFEILRVLARRKDGLTFLARDKSLDRKICLKVSAAAVESRASARLEHENIVRIFSDVRDSVRGLRTLCFQYVPGLSLAEIENQIDKPFTGKSLIALLDANQTESPEFNPAYLEQRARIGNFDGQELIAYLGLRLSEALEYAHSKGVAHGNLAPENILINSYGRPFLTDFADPPSEGAPGPAAYRADIVALAHLLGKLLVRRTEAKIPSASGLRSLDLAEILEAVTIDDKVNLPTRLRGFFEWQKMQNKMPRAGFIIRTSLRFPMLAILGVRQFPHIVGTAVCAAYCFYRRGMPLNEAQKAVMLQILKVYSRISYPLGIAIVGLLAYALVRRYRRRGRSNEIGNPLDLSWNRHSTLRLPLWLAGVNTLTWLPAVGVFTAASYGLTGRFHPSGFLHFLTAVVLSWLIATSYSTLYALFFSVQVLYPRFLDPIPEVRTIAANELKLARRMIAVMPAILAFIPLAAAILLLHLGPADLAPESFYGFRILLLGLITGGGLGLVLSIGSMHRLGKVIEAMTGSAPRRQAILGVRWARSV